MPSASCSSVNRPKLTQGTSALKMDHHVFFSIVWANMRPCLNSCAIQHNATDVLTGKAHTCLPTSSQMKDGCFVCLLVLWDSVSLHIPTDLGLAASSFLCLFSTEIMSVCYHTREEKKFSLDFVPSCFVLLLFD